MSLVSPLRVFQKENPEKQAPSSISSVLCLTLLHQKTAQQAVPGSAMLHNVSKGVVYSANQSSAMIKRWRNQGEKKEIKKASRGDPAMCLEGEDTIARRLDASGRWQGTSGASSNIIPVYCALLATVVLGLLAYVAFKCWRSHKQRQQLAKARTVELGDPDRDQRHGDSSVFVDSPRGLEPCIPSQGPHPDLGCRLYLHIPQQQQEEVQRLLMLGEPAKGWQGLAGHLGYQAEAVETMACDQVPAYTLLRDWAAQEGSRATLRVLEDALAAIGREDVVRVLSSPPAEGCSVV
ncbi:death domain-containing membrane protein NRADD isoform X2 [Grammomys surdaster]|uniref:death domain-containing membrane protein NRADD isoform X2 n=1 Tax=Grammomys surdaster TaxID=491861 RepID=UPI0010A0AC87|nr:death domain-containing membrane protein NRADD isoform X2 [Grammomys surdaster]